MHRPGCHWPGSYRHNRHVCCLSDAQERRGKLRAWWAESITNHRLHQDARPRVFCVDVLPFHSSVTATLTIPCSICISLSLNSQCVVGHLKMCTLLVPITGCLQWIPDTLVVFFCFRHQTFQMSYCHTVCVALKNILLLVFWINFLW